MVLAALNYVLRDRSRLYSVEYFVDLDGLNARFAHHGIARPGFLHKINDHL
jgi:hypothetical protein